MNKNTYPEQERALSESSYPNENPPVSQFNDHPQQSYSFQPDFNKAANQDCALTYGRDSYSDVAKSEPMELSQTIYRAQPAGLNHLYDIQEDMVYMPMYQQYIPHHLTLNPDSNNQQYNQQTGYNLEHQIKSTFSSQAIPTSYHQVPNHDYHVPLPSLVLNQNSNDQPFNQRTGYNHEHQEKINDPNQAISSSYHQAPSHGLHEPLPPFAHGSYHTKLENKAGTFLNHLHEYSYKGADPNIQVNQNEFNQQFPYSMASPVGSSFANQNRHSQAGLAESDLYRPRYHSESELTLPASLASRPRHTVTPTITHTSTFNTTSNPIIPLTISNPPKIIPSTPLPAQRRASLSSLPTQSNTTYHTCTYPNCTRSFKRPEHLKRHIKSLHTMEKPFSCHYPDCNRRFSRSDNLNQHYKVHRPKPHSRRNSASNLNVYNSNDEANGNNPVGNAAFSTHSGDFHPPPYSCP